MAAETTPDLNGLPQPIKGRCGTCDWPTDRLPCPCCEAVRKAALTAALSDGAR